MKHSIGVCRSFLHRMHKCETRNTKFETIPNDQNRNDRNFVVEHSVFEVVTHGWVVIDLNIRALNLFRPALARRRCAIVWSLEYFATQVQVRIP